MGIQDDWNGNYKLEIDDEYRSRKKRCPACGAVTIYFTKPSQHENFDCEYCGKPLIRWKIKQKVWANVL